MELHEWQELRDEILDGWNRSDKRMRNIINEDIQQVSQTLQELSPYMNECQVTWTDSRRA